MTTNEMVFALLAIIGMWNADYDVGYVKLAEVPHVRLYHDSKKYGEQFSRDEAQNIAQVYDIPMQEAASHAPEPWRIATQVFGSYDTLSNHLSLNLPLIQYEARKRWEVWEPKHPGDERGSLTEWVQKATIGVLGHELVHWARKNNNIQFSCGFRDELNARLFGKWWREVYPKATGDDTLAIKFLENMCMRAGFFGVRGGRFFGPR